MLKPIAAVAVLVVFGAPSFAADEYYVVRGPDKQCKIVEERPTTTTITIVGDDVYETRREAEAAMKRICRIKTDDDDDDND